jgi:hypothetical protein
MAGMSASSIALNALIRDRNGGVGDDHRLPGNASTQVAVGRAVNVGVGAHAAG